MIDTIPALIKPLPDSQVMVESLIENVHRANLKPMEQAKAILEVFTSSDSAMPRNAIDDRLPQKIQNIMDKNPDRPDRERALVSISAMEEDKAIFEVFKTTDSAIPGLQN